MGRHGRGALRARAGGAGRAGPLRRGCAGSAGRVSAGRDVRPRRRERGTDRHGVGAAGPVRAGMRVDGAVGERGHLAQRGDRTQHRGTGRGADRGSVQPGGRDAVRLYTGRADVKNGRGRHGRGICSGGTSGSGRGGTERGVIRCRAEHLGRQWNPPGRQRPSDGH